MAKPDIKIKFQTINVLSKTMNPKPPGPFNDELFHFDINGHTIVQPEKKSLVSVVTVNIRELNKENVLASISIASEFLLENFEEILDHPKDNVYNIPIELDVLIKTMSISTARGVMFSEFKGTYLSKAILPIIFLPTAPPDAKNPRTQPESQLQE